MSIKDQSINQFNGNTPRGTSYIETITHITMGYRWSRSHSHSRLYVLDKKKRVRKFIWWHFGCYSQCVVGLLMRVF